MTDQTAKFREGSMILNRTTGQWTLAIQTEDIIDPKLEIILRKVASLGDKILADPDKKVKINVDVVKLIELAGDVTERLQNPWSMGLNGTAYAFEQKKCAVGYTQELTELADAFEMIGSTTTPDKLFTLKTRRPVTLPKLS